MNILGIDPGKGRTAMVLWDGDKVLWSCECEKNVTPEGLHGEIRAVDMYFDIDLVIREAVFIGGFPNSGLVTSWVTGMIDAMCWYYIGAMPIVIENKAWQKKVFGKAYKARGHAKLAAKEAAATHFGCEPDELSQDLADAWCIAQYGYLMREQLNALRRN